MLTRMAMEPPTTAPIIRPKKSHDTMLALGYLRDFLRYRHTPSDLLAKQRAEATEGAYSPRSGPSDDAGHAKRHEMGATFTHAVHDSLTDDDLTDYPDWAWLGWERDLKRLPAEERQAVLLMTIRNQRMDDVLSATGVTSSAMYQRQSRALLKMTKSLLLRNLP